MLNNNSVPVVTAEAARRWSWPDDVLPLSGDRHPLARYSDTAIYAYLEHISRFPEAHGRLPRLIRTSLGMSQPCPAAYILREAHIDINETNADLENFLLINGFEPDHFLTLNPAEYTVCYTCRFEVPGRNSERSLLTAQHLASAMQRIEEQVSSSQGLFAYSEIEVYTEKHKRIFHYRPPSTQGLAEFPFVNQQFRARPFREKRWDLHVKLPTPAKGIDFRDASSPEMLVLRQLFLRSGFYEIRSLSGNLIYTLQLVSATTAKRAFSNLVDWASRNGGVTAVELEVCTRFWRSSTESSCGPFIAPVPQVVEELSYQ